MKNGYFVITTCVLLIFAACSKDDNDNGNGNGNIDIINVPSKTIHGQMKKLLNFNSPEDQIYHKFEDYDLGAGSIVIGDGLATDFIIATGNVSENGEVFLEFATEVPGDKLTQMFKITGDDIETSPSNLKTTWHLSNFTLTQDDSQYSPKNVWPDYIEELPVFNDYVYETISYTFVCAEEDGTIKGTLHEHTLNLNLKKGWNIVKKITPRDEENKQMVTVDNIPADAFFHYGWQIIQ